MNRLMDQTQFQTATMNNGTSFEVIFTNENETYHEAFVKGSSAIWVSIQQGYEPYIRIVSFKSDMVVNVRDYPDKYRSFKKMALKVMKKAIQ